MFVPIVESMSRSGALVSVSHPSEIVSETLAIVGLVGACCLAAGAGATTGEGSILSRLRPREIDRVDLTRSILNTYDFFLF